MIRQKEKGILKKTMEGKKSRQKLSEVLNMDTSSPTTFISGQVLREVQLSQVYFYLLIPCSCWSTSTTLTLH